MTRQMVQHGMHYIMAYKLNPGSAFRASLVITLLSSREWAKAVSYLPIITRHI